MAHHSSEQYEESGPTVNRLIDVRHGPLVNLFYHPEGMGENSYVVAVGSLAGHSGFFTASGLELPPAAWGAVVDHMQGKNVGMQLSPGDFEAQGVWLLLPDSPAPIVVKQLPPVVRRDPYGANHVFTLSPRRRLKATADVQARFERMSNEALCVKVATQYGCVIGEDGTIYWVEALMQGEPIMTMVRKLNEAGDGMLATYLVRLADIIAKSIEGDRGSLITAQGEIFAGYNDADHPNRLIIRVTDVADLR